MSERNPADQPLREALEALERSAPDAPVPHPALVHRRPRWQLMLAPTVVTLAVGILIGSLGTQWLLEARSSALPTSSPQPSPTTASQAPASAIPSAAVGRFAWSTSPFEQGALATSIAYIDHRWIVTGSADGPAAWWSDDGVLWTASRVETASRNDRVASMGPVASVGSSLVSLGWWGPATGEDRVEGTYAWVSRDHGVSWQQTEAPPFGAAVTSGPAGLVAVPGWTGCCNETGPQALTARSDDGTTWQRIAADPVFADAALNSIAADSGGYVAVGGTWDPGSPGAGTSAAAWWSDDGEHWQRAAIDDVGDTSSDITQVVAGPKGFVAIGVYSGGTGPYATVIWTSPDGRTWQAQRLAEAGFPNGLLLGSDGVHLVAMGSSGGRVTAWTSSDGLAWTDEPVPQDLYPGDLAMGDGRVIAVANCGPTTDCFADILVTGSLRSP